MSNNQIKSTGLKVAYKNDGDSIIPHTRDENGFHNQEYGFHTLKETYDRLLKGYNRLITELYHYVEHRTYGLFSKMGGITLIKVCIIAIILLRFFLSHQCRDIRF